MTVGVSRNIIRFIPSLLILFCLSSASFAFQEQSITTNKNIYKRVVGEAAGGTNVVIVDDLVDFAKFGVGDTVLIIQMKGAQILVTGSYGLIQTYTGSPGKYEFLIISSTESSTRRIWFTNNLLNTYDVNADVQLIWVPSYYNAKVDAPLTCQAWDSTSKKGGVLTMIVGKTLTLNANIDVSGKGFAGGVTALGLGQCITTSTLLDKFAYNAGSDSSGFKGEGIVSRAWIDGTTQIPIYPDYGKGKGANFNAGGGGNGRFSGGGGGSNYGAGGKGGRESNDICDPQDGGLGGKQIKLTPLVGGLYMGGGGGGSTFTGSITATAGGRGGGIIIILCSDLVGNGHSILADGGSPSVQATGTGGAGGGGAGGSIAVYMASSASDFTVSAKGAKGGNNAGTFGEGGGGGGGLIWTNNPATITNVSKTVALGAAGTRPGGSTAGAGQIGENLTTFSPILNGFLFNTIRSSVTNNLTDSICSNVVPYPVFGTNPIGGSGSYTFQWQRRNDSGGPWTDISSSNIANYIFPPSFETDTFEIRRVVDDGAGITDISREMKLIVQPKILNNTINIYSDIVSLTDTVCWNGDPKLIDQAIPDIIVPTTKNLFYVWQDSTQAATWGATLGALKKYDPAAGILKTKWFRRKVTSGRCVDSTAIVRVTVLDTISKNIITTRFDTICHGGVFLNLNTDPGLGGGDNTYRYIWQYSQTGATGSWSTATGVATGSTYNPDEASSFYPGKLYYRRKVFSGAHNVCADSSKTAVRVDWPVITSNSIAADEVICSGSNPTPVTGSEPLNGAGSGTFLYTWQDSSKLHTWTNITGYIKVTGLSYSPPILTDTTGYRRVAYSSKCSSISNTAAKKVHKPITNFNVSLFSGTWDTTTCSGATPKNLNGFKPGTLSGTSNPANNIYQWISSSVKTTGYSDISGAVSEDYQPGSLTNATAAPVYFYYRRKVSNGACAVTSDSAVAIKVLPKISNNVITADASVCYNIVPKVLTGTALTGGDGTPKWQWQQSINGGANWSAATGTSTNQSYTAPPLTVPTQYRRLVFSGNLDCCKDTSTAKSIAINPLPVGTIIAAIDTICEGKPGQTFILRKKNSTGYPWKVYFNENSTIKPVVQLNSTDSLISVNPVISGSTTAYTSFVYKLDSIRDNNNCKATSLTGSRELFVFKVPVADAGLAADVCGPKYKLSGTKNVGTGNWTYPGVPVINSSATGNDITVTVDLPYVASWYHKYRFFWNVKNWTCSAKDSVDITFCLKPDSAKAGNDTTIYSLDKEIVLPYVTPTVGIGTWSVVSGGASQKNDSTFTNLSLGENVFKWEIINKLSTCVSSDEVTYTVDELIIPEGFSPNNDGINDLFEIKGLDLNNSDVTLTIVNSAGAEVYRTTNVNDTFIPWKGENSSGLTLPDGTYYYLLIIESTKPGNNTVQKTSGFVILKRDKIE